jgi:hypothetical protein
MHTHASAQQPTPCARAKCKPFRRTYATPQVSFARCKGPSTSATILTLMAAPNIRPTHHQSIALRQPCAGVRQPQAPDIRPTLEGVSVSPHGLSVQTFRTSGSIRAGFFLG